MIIMTGVWWFWGNLGKLLDNLCTTKKRGSEYFPLSSRFYSYAPLFFGESSTRWKVHEFWGASGKLQKIVINVEHFIGMKSHCEIEIASTTSLLSLFHHASLHNIEEEGKEAKWKMLAGRRAEEQ